MAQSSSNESRNIDSAACRRTDQVEEHLCLITIDNPTVASLWFVLFVLVAEDEMPEEFVCLVGHMH